MVKTQNQTKKKEILVKPVSTSGSEFDVEGIDADNLAPLSHILSCQHSSVWRRLVTISLHLHASSHPYNCLTDRIKRDVYKCINLFLIQRLLKERTLNRGKQPCKL